MTVTSVSDAINILGGRVATARAFGVSPSAVSYWRRNGIPYKFHHRMRIMLFDAGYPYSEDVFSDCRERGGE